MSWSAAASGVPDCGTPLINKSLEGHWASIYLGRGRTALRFAVRAVLNALALALLHSSLNVIRDFRSCWLVYGKLVQRRYLFRTVGTDKVSLKQVSLNAFLAVRFITARRLYRISEQFVVYWAR